MKWKLVLISSGHHGFCALMVDRRRAEAGLIALIDPSLEALLYTGWDVALLNLFLRFFDAFGCAKVAPLGHLLLELGFFPALLNPPDGILGPPDLFFVPTAFNEILDIVVDLRFKFTFFYLLFIPVFSRVFVISII